MKQITEDYVGFEIAKLLKEKGFDEPVNRFYEISTGKPSLVRSEYCRNSFTTSYATPTLQMATKWLREVHDLHITIKPYITEEGIMYLFEIYKLEVEKFTLIKSKTGFEKSEMANEAALLYVLKNLIDMNNEEKTAMFFGEASEKLIANGMNDISAYSHAAIAQEHAFKMTQWKGEYISYELINKICQLFMEHEAIEKYDKNAIEWIYNQLTYEQRS